MCVHLLPAGSRHGPLLVSHRDCPPVVAAVFICTPSAPAVLVRTPKPLLGRAVLQDFLSLQGEWHTVTRGWGLAASPSPAAGTTPARGSGSVDPQRGAHGLQRQAGVWPGRCAVPALRAFPIGVRVSCRAWPTLPRAGSGLVQGHVQGWNQGLWLSVQTCSFRPERGRGTHVPGQGRRVPAPSSPGRPVWSGRAGRRW